MPHIPDIARALIEGYRQQRLLDAADIHLLADLLPLVHVWISRCRRWSTYHGITHSRANADVAYDTFLRGHAAMVSAPLAGTAAIAGHPRLRLTIRGSIGRS